jgi:hypothetical protein
VSFEQRDPAIEALAATFYSAFDNRGPRIPTGGELLELFAGEASITRVADGIEIWDPQGFVEPRIAMLTDGTLTEFHEWETDSRTAVFADIASRWSTYEKQGVSNGSDYRGGGWKLMHLRRQAGRWLITSLLWQDRR